MMKMSKKLSSFLRGFDDDSLYDDFNGHNDYDEDDDADKNSFIRVRKVR